MTTAAVSRADLLRLLASAGDSGVAAMAGFAGFEPRYEASEPQSAPSPVERELGQSGNAPNVDLPPPVSARAVTGVRFYRVAAWREVPRSRPAGERPQWWHQARPIPADAPERDDEAPPEPEHLVPWRRLWPLLRAALGQVREQQEPDLERIVELTARGQVPRRLPRRKRHHWAPVCRIILDFSPHLEPFHEDFRRLIGPLRRLRGSFGLDVLVTTEGSEGPFVQLVQEDRWRPFADILPPADAPVLVVGDLGFYGGPGKSAAWARLGRRLRRSGVRPVALIPCPPRYWDPDLAGLYFPVAWDRMHRLPHRIVGPRPWPERCANPLDDPAAARLLDLLAPSIRMEPSLIRALRHRLSGREMDAGAEAAAWLHPDLERKHLAAEWAGQDTVEQRREAYCSYPLEERRLAGDLLLLHHRHLRRSVVSEEAGNLAQLMGEEAPPAADYLADSVRTLEQADEDLRRRMQSYAGRMGERQHRDAWRDERRAALWMLAHREQLLKDTRKLPRGLDVSTADWVLGVGGEPRVWTLFQQGQRLAMGIGRSVGTLLDPLPQRGETKPGSPLADLRLSDAPVQYAPLDDPDLQSSVPVTGKARIPLAGSGIVLRAQAEELTIEAMTKPAWAETIGRDAFGLYVEIGSGQGTRRLDWVSPAQGLSMEQAMELGTLRIPEGAFWDSRDRSEWARRELAGPRWANRTAVDSYGLFAEFDYKGITRRTRWIWPGEFAMGSPPEEPERADDERQHQVVLSRSFWLADTACTQALWQAVMGDKPSQFEGVECPVEQVSWAQVQKFIDRLNGAIPGLDLRLPTEAEWEYACRAGTKTPFSFGETVTTEQVNYHGGYPYRGGEKGEFRGQTVEVKALPANAWGLYQMHGNVWEWCSDGYGEYADETVIDPAGLTTGERRVVRGGCWIDGARSCRSARRYRWKPGSRIFILGFRLARGPTGRPAEPQSRAGQTQRSGVGV